MFYPEDASKGNWDLFITIVLLWTCIATPARIAFDDGDTVEVGWETVKWIVDFLFLIDIVINFNTAYQDDDFKTIEDRKKIATDYIFGWFFLDVFAIIPFTELASIGKQDQSHENGVNGLARIAKIGRLYKLIKLTKLLRVLKIIKEKNKLLKYVRSMVSLGQGFERLMFINLLFLMITHIVACLWIFFASFKEDYKGTWMEDGVDEMGK